MSVADGRELLVGGGSWALGLGGLGLDGGTGGELGRRATEVVGRGEEGGGLLVVECCEGEVRVVRACEGGVLGDGCVAPGEGVGFPLGGILGWAYRCCTGFHIERNSRAGVGGGAVEAVACSRRASVCWSSGLDQEFAVFLEEALCSSPGPRRGLASEEASRLAFR